MTIDRRNALRLTSLAVAGAGIATAPAAAARAAGPRAGSGRPTARQLVLTGKRTAADIPDVLVPGTPYFVHYELRDADGEPAGTESAQCTPVTVGPDGAFVLASLVLLLADGMLTASTAFARPLPALTEVLVAPRRWSHLFAVTGGTGAYDAATGSVTIEHLSREDDVLTVDLD
ncbi:hypothetical protein SAMN05216371_0719 [Streptomyces sp. TLI_053]|uniref:hypothetical protein n=1 Tax=Streptomyces sp. TLI_053 TaxID=1855352 RepID=UPI00087D16D3|nr:hypothetical protein [Streptomyces sp. TLI_053]SDS83816.1 hypothetical protein SAMN05216371_0719 [Streptomyces sp. TLI_053]